MSLHTIHTKRAFPSDPILRPCAKRWDYETDKPKLDGTLSTLSVKVKSLGADSAGGGPPNGFLLCLLSAEDEVLNRQLLHEVAAARLEVEAQCWGCQILSPRAGFDSMWRAGISTLEEPPPPMHSDLVALQCKHALSLPLASPTTLETCTRSHSLSHRRTLLPTFCR